MQFNARQIGHFEHFREKRAHMVEMRKNAFGAVATFAAENFIAVDTEPVEKILLFIHSFLDESRQDSSNGVEFSRMRFEIGMQTGEISPHVWNLCLAYSVSNNRRNQQRVSSGLCLLPSDLLGSP